LCKSLEDINIFNYEGLIR